MTDTKLLPCPFCGMQSEIEWEDTLHPSGSAWRDETVGTQQFRHYVRRDSPKGYHGLCYSLNCATVYGGCGVEMSGDSAEEVVAKWNRRATAGDENG